MSTSPEPAAVSPSPDSGEAAEPRGMKRRVDQVIANESGSHNRAANELSDEFPELLQFYYSELFPYAPFFRWLSYDGVAGRAATDAEKGSIGLQGSYVGRREFSFTLQDDVYIRYQSFSTVSELESEIKKKRPFKIDIGAVYNARPKDHKTIPAGVFKPLEKELVFDIDMTDYDEVRTCCSGADICSKCWTFMTIAIRVMDVALREDFGFEHLLWVYSGRRGIHCWVCDPRARALSQSGRSAVAEYLNVIHGSANSERKVFLTTPMHPSMARAAAIIEEYFETLVLEEQEMFACAERWEKILPLISDASARKGIEAALAAHGADNAEGVWEGIKDMYESNGYRATDIYEIMFQFCYPRLDIHVSKGLNHLLKSPFCVHPKTGRVCVPIDPQAADTFSPFDVPTVSQLVQELTDAKHGAAAGSSASPSALGSDDMQLEEASRPAYAKTSLAPYFAYFENEFLAKLLADLGQIKQAAAIASGNIGSAF